MSMDLLQKVRLVAFDVDGVFTDGRFYLSDDGVESKAFNTQDGFGVRRLIDADVAVAVISGRESLAVARRMSELGVRFVVQGCRDKVAALDEIIAELGVTIDQCAFVGDDIPDLPALEHAGVSIAVANAVASVRERCDITTGASGGAGAVREVSDMLLAAKGFGFHPLRGLDHRPTDIRRLVPPLPPVEKPGVDRFLDTFEPPIDSRERHIQGFRRAGKPLAAGDHVAACDLGHRQLE